MLQRILESPVFRTPRPWWLPLLSLAINLHGIIFLGWSFQPLVFIFWMEVIFLLAFALLRMVFALDGKPWTEGLGKKLFLLGAGAAMSIGMVMLTVTFTIKAFDQGFSSEGFEKVPFQTRLLLLGYIAGLIIHYFGNQRYKTANPMSELMAGFIHVLVLLCLIMPITMHLLPKYPQLNQALWVGVAVVVVKFMVDRLFVKSGNKIAGALKG
ncbi:MAG: hypothetical protein JNJ57_04920 [Saprospiraceae bacterium]|nr:hypothetical protein [Saprospiraceae bacterium]